MGKNYISYNRVPGALGGVERKWFQLSASTHSWADGKETFKINVVGICKQTEVNLHLKLSPSPHHHPCFIALGVTDSCCLYRSYFHVIHFAIVFHDFRAFHVVRVDMSSELQDLCEKALRKCFAEGLAGDFAKGFVKGDRNW